jgi:hypothetical protein
VSTDDDLPELPADAREAIAAAKATGLVGPSGDVRARMRARLVGSLPGGGGSEGDGGGGDGSGAGSGRGSGGAGLPKAPLWVVAAALAVGGAVGFFVPRAPIERVIVVNAPGALASVATAPTSLVAAAASPGLPSIDTKDLPSAPSVAASANAGADASTARGGDDLAAERAALDVARTALGRGDGANALAACDEHARKFPRGALGEEREAIAVQALVLEHRTDDARARAERFRKTHPRSILLPAVLAAAGVEP